MPHVRVLESPSFEWVFVSVMEGVGVRSGGVVRPGVGGPVGVVGEEEGEVEEGRVMARRKRSLSGILEGFVVVLGVVDIRFAG